MKFTIKTFKPYKLWFESDNGEFAIGLVDYLLGMKCVQVLHNSKGNFYVIKEYKGYDLDEVNKLIKELEKVFDGIPDDLNGDYWYSVNNKLPKYNRKYIDKK